MIISGNPLSLIGQFDRPRKNINQYISVSAVTELGVYTLKYHEFWLIFGDGWDGKGPII